MAGNTYRVVFDLERISGKLYLAYSSNGALTSVPYEDTTSGIKDVVFVAGKDFDKVEFGEGGFDYLGSIKNLRVIKMNELSPSADFSSSTGFATDGGVTIDTVNKQAVFGSGAGTKYVSFVLPSSLKGKDIRIAFKVNGATQGTYRINSNSLVFKSYTNETNDDFEVTYVNATGNTLFFTTVDGWDGNVEYLSVTEVTDGAENGAIVKGFEKHWKPKSGEDLLPQYAGTVKFGKPSILTAGTYEIEPMANAGEGSSLLLSRSGTDEPEVTLSAGDIALGYQITHPNTQPDTSVILNTNDVYRLVKRGFNLELVRG